VVLADAEDVEADLVGKLDLLEEVSQPPCRADLRADVGEGVEAKFHHRFLSDPHQLFAPNSIQRLRGPDFDRGRGCQG
jgi:hypothetical protein